MSLAIAMTVPMTSILSKCWRRSTFNGFNKSSCPPHQHPTISFRHRRASKRAKSRFVVQMQCEQTSKGQAGTLLALLAAFFLHRHADGGFARLLASDLATAMPTFARLLAVDLRKNGESTAKARGMPFFNKMMKREIEIEEKMI